MAMFLLNEKREEKWEHVKFIKTQTFQTPFTSSHEMFFQTIQQSNIFAKCKIETLFHIHVFVPVVSGNRKSFPTERNPTSVIRILNTDLSFGS